MLRFCGENLVKQSGEVHIEIAEQHLVFDEKIWQTGKAYYKSIGYHDYTKLQFIPVVDICGDLICYGYQDGEANRELRMLKELIQNRDVLQFGDIYSDIREVIVCGCNELAYFFVKYLEAIHIPTVVVGRYWKYFGYTVSDIDFDDSNKMIIYAEHIMESTENLFERIFRSASPQFECIDKIYEANVLAGNIKDVIGGMDWLLNRLKKENIVILGIDDTAQDTYDLICAQGMDIQGFAIYEMSECDQGSLLGKRIMAISEILCKEMNVTLIDVCNKNSTFGNRIIELFDYYGYERNKNFFMINDYTNIPCSNLIHVLRGKRVFLTGDERLCKILEEYFAELEHGHIELQYAEMPRKGMFAEEDIICAVYLWFEQNIFDKKPQILKEYLKAVPHTNYFSRVEVFARIEHYRTKCRGKYHIKRLIPKGVLINDTFTHSGNAFFKGILDGHPDILLLQFGAFSYNLFSYCIRLSIEKSGNILIAFRQMLKMEMDEDEFQREFPFWNKFEKSMEKWLSFQESFTSQELFVLFHVAVYEMMGEKIAGVSQKVIYMDPHLMGPADRFALRDWLQCEEFRVQMVTMRRDHTTWLYSRSSHAANVLKVEKLKLAYNIVAWMTQDNTFLQYEKIEVRFEDLKLHPEEELLKICEQIGISMSDSMFHTSAWGKMSSMGAIRDFDLKPVFNKHETDWSEFDRFRIYLLSSPYQKKFGYSYEDCMKFSRIELQEIFLKGFRFQQGLQFNSEEKKSAYYLWVYETIRWKLWENRKHIVLDDIEPIFKPVEIGKTKKELTLEKQQAAKLERERLTELIRGKEKMVLYGLGKDGAALWKCLNESIRSCLVLCDKKADKEKYCFHGIRVVKPVELCTKYRDYEILVTSSQFWREIKVELCDGGVSADRIICNTIPLWEEET